MAVTTLVSEPHVIRADMTGRYVVVTQSIGLPDTDPALTEVRAVLGDLFDHPNSDEIKDTDYYLYGKARIRNWLL